MYYAYACALINIFMPARTALCYFAHGIVICNLVVAHEHEERGGNLKSEIARMCTTKLLNLEGLSWPLPKGPFFGSLA